MRGYFVLSFALMAILAVALGVNFWITLTGYDLYWLAIPAVVIAGVIAIWSAWMSLVAAVSTYRKR